MGITIIKILATIKYIQEYNNTIQVKQQQHN